MILLHLPMDFVVVVWIGFPWYCLGMSGFLATRIKKIKVDDVNGGKACALRESKFKLEANQRLKTVSRSTHFLGTVQCAVDVNVSH